MKTLIKISIMCFVLSAVISSPLLAQSPCPPGHICIDGPATEQEEEKESLVYHPSGLMCPQFSFVVGDSESQRKAREECEEWCENRKTSCYCKISKSTAPCAY